MGMNLCFPDENEKEYLDVAKRLSLSCLWFLYNDLKEINRRKDEKIKIYYGITRENADALNGEIDFILCSLLKSGANKGKKIIYYVGIDYLDNLTQVKIKEILDTNKKVIVPLNLVLEAEKSPRLVEKTIFLIHLFKKYNIDFCVSNFANSPYELRSEKEVLSVCDFLGVKKRRKSALLRQTEIGCSFFFP
jgi:hypothetical protein